MNRLIDKVAIITGAGSGQGAAEARLFAREGARVVLTDVNVDAVTALSVELGGDHLAMRHDVSQETDWADVVATVLEKYGKIDILVNNAGIYDQGLFQNTDAATLDRYYSINARGTFLGMKAVQAAMLDAGGGSIINISSLAGARGVPNTFGYASSKWMVRGMSKCAAIDLAESKIRVNAILPGLIDTPMIRINPPEFVEAFTNAIPAKRLGTTDDIANAALYLASDESSYVMGAEISVCGAIGA